METMKTIWDRIHVWLKDNAPVVLASLRPGASEKAIRAAEREMGVRLPDDVRACYRIHDGADLHSFLYGWEWLGLEGMLIVWRMFNQQFEAGEFDGLRTEAEDGGVRPEWWYPAWIPITADPRGYYMCLDLAPEPGGDIGQILYWYPDTSDRTTASPGFTLWLEDFVYELEEGEWGYSEEWGGLASMDDIEFE
jgi:cell wall assembly regulator SMI1